MESSEIARMMTSQVAVSARILAMKSRCGKKWQT